jgi:hypothetical protein
MGATSKIPQLSSAVGRADLFDHGSRWEIGALKRESFPEIPVESLLDLFFTQTNLLGEM